MGERVTPRPHMADVTQRRVIEAYWQEGELVPESELLMIVAGDAFDHRLDSPQIGDRVVLTSRESVVRGTVREIAYVIEVDG